MAGIGDGWPDSWSAALERDGRVIFPLRRRAILENIGLLWLVVIVSQPLAYSERDSNVVRLIFVGLFVSYALGVTAWYCWRLATHYPALTIDELGIRVGRKKFLPWSEVGAVGLTRGWGPAQVLPILPKNPWGKELLVPRAAVRSVPALARWLEGLLKEKA
ncbi:hypothetical protein [Kribbella ginsengisoli]|uniref:PH domain-containing protein n=1 Tax=Kribbella ginsengisoli TaxID=363865 RepID=A0ABP6WHW3_9ACTN